MWRVKSSEYSHSFTICKKLKIILKTKNSCIKNLRNKRKTKETTQEISNPKQKKNYKKEKKSEIKAEKNQ